LIRLIVANQAGAPSNPDPFAGGDMPSMAGVEGRSPWQLPTNFVYNDDRVKREHKIYVANLEAQVAKLTEQLRLLTR
jgi:hypothetical protein